jgi:hypothetical protein
MPRSSKAIEKTVPPPSSFLVDDGRAVNLFLEEQALHHVERIHRGNRYHLALHDVSGGERHRSSLLLRERKQ